MATGTDLVTIAAGELGKPYVYGTDGPNTFDCSGLTEWAAAQLGISLPHNAAAQQQATVPVTSPQPGDLVFYGSPAYHVGIYAGNGQMISAPHAGATVHLTSVGTPTGYGRIKGIGGITGAVSGVVDGLLDPTAVLDKVGSSLKAGLFVLLGLGLLGVGLWQSLSPAARANIRHPLKGASP